MTRRKSQSIVSVVTRTNYLDETNLYFNIILGTLKELRCQKNNDVKRVALFALN
jgi:hypothetical protein